MLRGEIEYVSFDSACTLFWDIGCDPRNPFRPTRVVLENILSKLRGKGYSYSRDIDPLELYVELWRDIESKHPGHQHWHRYVLTKLLWKLGIRLREEELAEIYRDFIIERAKWFLPIDNTKKVIEELIGKGYKLVLTTATGAHDLPYNVLKYNDLLDRFEIIHSTQLTGIPKHNPLFYRELAEILGVEPKRIVHIGDSLENDVFPAMKAGLKTIYYGWRTLCRPTDPRPCITRLTDLLKIL